jgi:hypothetical protein
MRRRLGRLDGGGTSCWRRLGALLRPGVGGLTAAATSGLRFSVRVLRAGFMRCATCKMDRPPYRYGGQVNKNKNKDGARHIDMAIKLSLQYTR